MITCISILPRATQLLPTCTCMARETSMDHAMMSMPPTMSRRRNLVASILPAFLDPTLPSKRSRRRFGRSVSPTTIPFQARCFHYISTFGRLLADTTIMIQVVLVGGLVLSVCLACCYRCISWKCERLSREQGPRCRALARKTRPYSRRCRRLPGARRICSQA